MYFETYQFLWWNSFSFFVFIEQLQKPPAQKSMYVFMFYLLILYAPYGKDTIFFYWSESAWMSLRAGNLY